MALTHWFPLTEHCYDAINHDSQEAAILMEGTLTKGGPLGGYLAGCSLRFEYHQILNYERFINGKELSVAWWSVGNGATVVLGITERGNFSSSYFTFRARGGADGPWGVQNFQHTVSLSEWHHYAFTWRIDKGLSYYIDGKLIGTVMVECTSIRRPVSAILMQGDKMSDVRVYSHCLSQAEIKKLNQCLVIHQTFNNRLREAGIYVNLLPLDMQEKEVRVDSQTYGDPVWYEVSSGLTQGSPYTLSAYITRYLEDITVNARMSLILTYSDGTSVSDSIVIQGQDGVERFYTVTINADPNKTLTKLSGWILDHSSGHGKVMSYRRAALVANELPFVPTQKDNTDLLESREEYWTPIKHEVHFSNDSVDGGRSYKGTTEAYIYYPSFTTKDCFKQQATASMWVKADITKNWVVFADFMTELGFGMYEGVGIIASATNTNKRTVTNVSALWKTDGWNHVVVLLKSGENRCWINGIEGEYGSADYWTHNKGFYIGCRNSGGTNGMHFTGLLDDFRFYNRGLDEQDILELYRTALKLTESGGVCAKTFVEGKTGNKIKRGPAVECSEIWENIDPDYERLEYIESNGAQYIDTGIGTSYSGGDKTPVALWANYEMTNYSPGQILCGAYNGTTTHYFNYKEASSTTVRTHWFYTDFTTDVPWSNGLKVTSRLNIPVSTHPNDLLEFTINGKRLTGKPTTRGGTGINMFLTAFNRQGTPGYYFHCKLYGFRIWIASQSHPDTMGQDLVRNFIPCRRKSDGAVGLFDTVEERFYTSQGSSQYIAGPTVADGAAKFFKDGKISGSDISEF